MNGRKLLFWGVGMLILVAVVVSLVLRSASPGGTAVDTTGNSTVQTPNPLPSTPTPGSTEVNPPPITSGDHQPFIVLDPPSVPPGSRVAVLGSDFDPKATIDFFVKQRQSDKGNLLAYVQADKTGTFDGVTLTMPDSQPFGSFIIEARQRQGAKIAQANGLIENGGTAKVKLSAQVGKVGDVVVASLQGFASREQVTVYWNSLSTDPIQTLQADGGGGIGQAHIRVPFGPVGDNAFIFIGQKSQSPVTISFLMLNIYPAVKISSYSIKADNVLTFSGKNFGPSELVLVYVNKPGGLPLVTVRTNDQGAFPASSNFLIPFSLKGKQTLIFLGSQSHTSVNVTFTVAPYQPNVQPSTYGGSPGTAVSFYATGFARNELVHIYIGAAQNNPGKMVGCFNANAQGAAGAQGSYMIPSDAQVGKLTFTLVGSKSGGVGTATIQVAAPETPVQVPPQPPFTCPLDGK